jgi:O-antigen ligase
MSQDLAILGALGLVSMVALYIWARAIIYYEPRPPMRIRRHPGAKRSRLDKWLGIK